VSGGRDDPGMRASRRRFLGASASALLVAPSADPPAAPPTPVPAGTRSGLPWNSGVSTWKPDGFADWRRRPLDMLTVFSRFDTWEQMERLGRPGTMLGEMLHRPERLVVSLAMFPRRDGPVPRDEPALWDDTAAGSCDARWERGIRHLRGLTDRDDFVFRPGWEWNTRDSYPWGVEDERWAEAYRTTFRRLVTIVRSSFPGSEIDWCSLKKGRTRESVDAFYPGDDVVDYIGHARYDRGPAATSSEAWDGALEESAPSGGPLGPMAWLRYAQAKGKRLAIAEWGVWSRDGRGGGGGGDNPLFIERMFDFFRTNAAWIGYECYFNQTGGEAMHLLGPDESHNPKAAEAYRRLCAGIEAEDG
jgi:hypothetical protein